MSRLRKDRFDTDPCGAGRSADSPLGFLGKPKGREVMTVRVKAFGQMKRYFGEQVREAELPAGARLSDLLLHMEKRWRSQIPDFLWDEKKHGFRGPVVIIIDKQAATDLRTKLADGQEVELHKVLVGG